MEKQTKMAAVASLLHKNYLQLGKNSSLYLFCGKTIVNNNM